MKGSSFKAEWQETKHSCSRKPYEAIAEYQELAPPCRIFVRLSPAVPCLQKDT